ncbi:MAG: hypothetical protein RBS57_04285 [Desulforhabdus sp.]|jgi:DNA topoisomerase-1|nr:hypothetical protein [Desulforhabdus sp.]
MGNFKGIAPEQQYLAREVGLRYISDEAPGISRRRAGKGFSYFDSRGQRIRDRAELARIKALATPPGWKDVWICPRPDGHIQVTGRDNKGRKQYLYHPLWRELRDRTKFEQMAAFGRALQVIRDTTDRHLRLHGLSREKILAAVVRLLEATLVRIGNKEYERENRSFGLTTLKDEHLRITGSLMHFRFRGKGGKEHSVKFHDRRLAKVVKRCQDLPGHELFQYSDENGENRAIDSSDVNSYLQEITGQEFTAKDFRTWGGTVHAAVALMELGSFGSLTEANRKVVEAVKHAASRLGNKPAACRKYYIHPGIIQAYLEQRLIATMQAAIDREVEEQISRLQSEERGVLAILEDSAEEGLKTEARKTMVQRGDVSD